ncbi:hypothetical protein [Methanolacinia petrolearia]|uniref:hypothetical protein n=1 Tax=Methanolacinia petrolearia TaxID=54120 RepID=UPI0011D07331|nr:hypothetical protein [Methanolacinia petrolearia]
MACTERNVLSKLNSTARGALVGPKGVQWEDYLKARPLGMGRPAAWLPVVPGVAAGGRHKIAKRINSPVA